MVELPTSVRYVKSGAGGRWWPDAKARSRIHAGWSSVPDELIRSGDMPAIEAVIQAEFGAKPNATQDANALPNSAMQAQCEPAPLGYSARAKIRHPSPETTFAACHMEASKIIPSAIFQ